MNVKITSDMVRLAVNTFRAEIGAEEGPVGPYALIAMRRALEMATAMIPEHICPPSDRQTHVVVTVDGVMGPESYRLEIEGPPAKHGAHVDTIQVTERMP